MSTQETNDMPDDGSEMVEVEGTDKKVKIHNIYGIADCHGIESWLPVKKDKTDKDMQHNVSMMMMRADANRQRHSVVYLARLLEHDFKKFTGYCEKGSPKYDKEALECLKQRNLGEVKLLASGNAKKSWGLIPNSELDPYN